MSNKVSGKGASKGMSKVSKKMSSKLSSKKPRRAQGSAEARRNIDEPVSKSLLQQFARSGLFKDFPSEVREQLAAVCQAQSYQAGQMIYLRGDKPVGLYGVLEGAVKLIGEDPQGKFYLYGAVGRGRWFGEAAALDGEPRGQSAQMAGVGKLVCVPRRDLLKLLDRQPELYRYFVAVFCKRLRQAGDLFEDAAFLPVGLRLAKQLLQIDKVRVQNNIKLTQEELAASLGVTRQSIFRVLQDWRDQGWVLLEYGNVRLERPDQLRAWVRQNTR